MPANLPRLNLGRGQAGLRGGYRAEEPNLSRVRLRRESEALEAFALMDKDNCAVAFLFPMCSIERISSSYKQTREAAGIPSL